MDWLQVLTIAASVVGSCWMMHKESMNLHLNLSDEFRKEIKDFHGRLCTLEERYIQLMQRQLEQNKK